MLNIANTYNLFLVSLSLGSDATWCLVPDIPAKNGNKFNRHLNVT